jgi:NFU1 iron-sulfur cluster scaffold homolog, mitochondrial
MMAKPVQYNAEKLYSKLTYIYTEASPNPNSMKFVLNSMLSEDEDFIKDYAEASVAAESPLATALFAFPFVRRVFLTKNFITVTKDEQIPWDDIVPGMKTFLKEYIESGKTVMEFDDYENELKKKWKAEQLKVAENDTETVKKIKGILDEYIRPAVEGDGGAISFHAFDEVAGTLKVTLQGSCSGCPSSTVTLKAGIENLFKRMMPDQVKTVVAEGV